ncbi:MAG: carboxypeptidase regulatory-like domain-containing protein [Myxococcales bacterium]|nr:carboxypeptidase regulatory-like domain-containing protein [Myxococcales bacterium]
MTRFAAWLRPFEPAILLLLPVALGGSVGCHSQWSSDEGPTDTGPAPDLTAALATDEVRAGVVTDAAALFGGISSEGRLGDVKIYNDRARFVIQQPGLSNYYVEYGGSLIDADIVRPAGQPGRDLVDELVVMIGLARVVNATEVTVDADGADGVARVRVEGVTEPMHLITGALETPTLVADLDLYVTTLYELRPGEHAMTVTTTVENRDPEDATLQIGDVGIVTFDLGEHWTSRAGLDDPDTGSVWMSGVMGQHNEVTVGILGDGVDLEQGSLGQMLAGLAPSIAGFSAVLTIPAGGSQTFVRRVGVALDPASLLSEAWQRSPVTKQLLSGVVTDTAGEPVGGARVHVLDAAGEPLSVAFSDTAGAWAATVPAGPVTLVTTGRGAGYIVDLPPGHAQISPYEVDQAASLATLTSGAAPPVFAEGYGFSAPSGPRDPQVLVAPGWIDVEVAGGEPAVVRVDRTDADVAVDARIVPGRPGGSQVYGFVRDGDIALPVEPGSYHVVVRRGVRDEVWTADVVVESGVRVALAAALVQAYELDGVWVGDPHSHAAPSADGGIPMEDRLLVTAAAGVDIHFGTDHDHLADYRPLLAPLGLDGALQSVLAGECSPVLRGHFNVWPAQEGLTGVNHGAPMWWYGYIDTEEIFGWMRDSVVPGGVVQANHPVGSSGMFSFAGYDPTSGKVSSREHWADDFDTMELLNSDSYQENWDYYLDLTRRGKRVTPVGVSDSHTWTSGSPGLNVTFFQTGAPFSAYTEEGLLDAVARRATVVSHGPYIDARMGGVWAPGAEVAPGTLDVIVQAPSWMPVETVSLWADGDLAQTITCSGVSPTPCVVSFDLNPFSDAVYVVEAESVSSPMVEAWPGHLAWAATSGIYVDATGDGWDAPYPWMVQ